MKKLITFLIAILYLGVSSGIALQVHYCMGEVAALTVVPADSDKCNTCGMEDNPCCRDEVTFIKIQDAHKQPVISFEAQQFVSLLPESGWSLSAPTAVQATIQSFSDGSPPFTTGPKRHVLHCRYNV